MWVIGQRVMAQTEPELGVGAVTHADRRVVEVQFRASGVTRRYSAQASPLRRLTLRSGQRATTKTGTQFVVKDSREEQGLWRYSGDGFSALETELSDEVPDQSVVERFLSGPWSAPRTYDLRRAGWELLRRSLAPDLRGLMGARVSLLPHQLHIAHQVSRRALPRVLLADEVGLGKTIEAGLIFSSLRSLERAGRVLVLAPDSLKHQWLAELYRRFNELFSIVGEDLEADGVDFISRQRVISSVEFLSGDPPRLASALAEPWDLLIVDEAHHLEWNGPAWRLVKALSERARGLLLLTATPRQRGLETQFGLLHLVDPQRFADFEVFRSESAELRATADLARKLFEGDVSEATLSAVREKFPNDSDVVRLTREVPARGPADLLNALIDRHGTGRSLMRNRRERLEGFPARRLHSVPLDGDTKLDWLVGFLGALAPQEKALLLCSTPATVKRLDTALKSRVGLKRTLFHENMDLVERDRQAAWFADPRGAQLLISSEIGGEGRNFQFAHKLVMYDLPAHPDLLEQRIGRLDRIGQRKEIQIYVPWIKDSAEEVYFRWYAHGLKSFDRAWNGGAALMESLRGQLRACAQAFTPAAPGRQAQLEALLELTRAEVERVQAQNRESVDVLIDLNSFDREHGESLRARIRDADRDPFVREYMEAIFDHYGVEAEDFDESGTLKLSAHSLTFVESFPELPPGSEILATFDRAQALAREDLRLLTSDHPMVKGALSLLLDRDEGRVSIGRRGQPRAEFLFVLQVNAAAALEVERYLPVTLIEIVIDERGRPTVTGPDHAPEPIDVVWAHLPESEQRQAARARAELLPEWLEAAAQLAHERSQGAIRAAKFMAEEQLRAEEARLVQLSRVNPGVRPEELVAHRVRTAETLTAIERASPRLDALRLVIS